MAKTILTLEQMQTLSIEEQNRIIHEEMEKLGPDEPKPTKEKILAELDEILAK